MKKGTCRFHTSRMRAVRVRPVQACPRAALPSEPAGQKSSSRSKVPLLLVTGSSAGSRTVGPCHGRRPTARSVFFCGPGQWRGASGNGARRELRSLRPTSLSPPGARRGPRFLSNDCGAQRGASSDSGQNAGPRRSASTVSVFIFPSRTDIWVRFLV